jgi:pSer/pThr/pTyr-binding forkhead associated (FHA) protein
MGSPAGKAGIHPGDILASWSGQRRNTVAEKLILVLRNDNGTTREFAFDQPTICLAGRSDGCLWRSSSSFVSRRHCQFVIDPPYATVRDLGSLNGTFVNGSRIDGEYDLVDGDVVQVGEMTWTLATGSQSVSEQHVRASELLEI